MNSSPPNLSLEFLSSEPSSSTLASTIQWKSDPQTVSTLGSIHTVQSLFHAALQATSLRSLQDPVRYYISNTSHPLADESGSSLKSYLQEYLYTNLSSVVSLAATTGDINLLFESQEPLASTIASHTVHQGLYDQMAAAAPERFSTASTTTNYQPLPFQSGDTLVVRIRFRFPAALIQTSVAEHVLRIKNGNLFVATGNKIQVSRPQQVPVLLNDFPNCVVELRVKLGT